jgi:phage shock protein A
MNVFDRLRLAVRSLLHNLFSEEALPARQTASEEHVAALLDEAQVRLEALRQELIEATVREKRAELEWHAAQAQAEAADQKVDEVLRAGQDEAARRELVLAQAQQKRVEALNARYTTSQELTRQLQTESLALQQQLDETRRRYQELTERERTVAAQEQLAQLRRAVRQAAATLRAELGAREERVARREDQAAARDELNRRP